MAELYWTGVLASLGTSSALMWAHIYRYHSNKSHNFAKIDYRYSINRADWILHFDRSLMVQLGWFFIRSAVASIFSWWDVFQKIIAQLEATRELAAMPERKKELLGSLDNVRLSELDVGEIVHALQNYRANVPNISNQTPENKAAG